MKNLYKITMFTTMAMGSVMAISSYTWTGMWMGLEINLLTIIPLMSSSSNKMASESALKYFIIQAMASAMLLFSILLLMIHHSYLNSLIKANVFTIILNSSILTKMGAAPFHFWFPEIMEGLNWMNCLLLMTWQKLAPMAVIMYSNKPIMFMSMIIGTSMLISGIMGINQTSMRKILTFSSINHIAWMISSMIFNETIWMLYFLTYAVISINIVLMLNSLKIFFIKQITMINQNNLIKTMFMINFLSLGGLPPFLGFMPKWLTIQTLMNNHMFTLAFIMVLATLVTLFFYTRLTFSSMLMNMNEPKWLMTSKMNLLIVWFNLGSLSSLILSTMMFNWM